MRSESSETKGPVIHFALHFRSPATLKCMRSDPCPFHVEYAWSDPFPVQLAHIQSDPYPFQVAKHFRSFPVFGLNAFLIQNLIVLNSIDRLSLPTIAHHPLCFPEVVGIVAESFRLTT